ncbi:MAG TPA: 4Fe-4S dicluster domain-containing protein [Symbiobacteriaceae bacterium]|nr:4Fe-4S dicluster domain-containing protein [Symbiobacteriaceae bacterium]
MFNLKNLLRIVDPDPVLINQQACLRARHVRSGCRACSDVCPPGAVGFSDRKLKVDAAVCVRCGLCLGACPTAALQVRGIDEEALGDSAFIRCARAPGEGVELPCLGALSPDHLIDLGSRRPGVTLVAGDCTLCPLSRGGELAKASLAVAAELLKALGVVELPHWQNAGPAAEAPASRAVNRRELLTLWGSTAAQTGRSLLPDREVNPVRLPAKVPARRLRWLKRFAPPEHRERIAWPNRAVQPGCHGCSICVNFCPTGALTSRESGDGAWTLGFQAAACVDCKTCVGLCPRSVLQPAEAPALSLVLGGGEIDLVTVPGSDRPLATGFRPTR